MGAKSVHSLVQGYNNPKGTNRSRIPVPVKSFLPPVSDTLPRRRHAHWEDSYGPPSMAHRMGGIVPQGQDVAVPDTQEAVVWWADTRAALEGMGSDPWWA